MRYYLPWLFLVPLAFLTSGFAAVLAEPTDPSRTGGPNGTQAPAAAPAPPVDFKVKRLELAQRVVAA